MPTVAARTHVGLVRRRNEDAHYVGSNLAAVADGMGGHVAGDVASGTVIDAVRAYDKPVDIPDLGDHLGRAINAASLSLRNRIVRDPAVAGMGTTLVAAVWNGRHVVIGNVGDSRAYLIRGGLMVQVTDDHVFSRLLANAGNVPRLPERLARFLDGRVDGRAPDLAPMKLGPGDRLLLCSDGLSSFVTHDAIQRLVGAADLDEAVDDLIDATLRNGAPDNVTAVLVGF